MGTGARDLVLPLDCNTHSLHDLQKYTNLLSDYLRTWIQNGSAWLNRGGSKSIFSDTLVWDFKIAHSAGCCWMHKSTLRIGTVDFLWERHQCENF